MRLYACLMQFVQVRLDGREVDAEICVSTLGMLLRLSVPKMFCTLVRVCVTQSCLAEVSFRQTTSRTRGYTACTLVITSVLEEIP